MLIQNEQYRYNCRKYGTLQLQTLQWNTVKYISAEQITVDNFEGG